MKLVVSFFFVGLTFLIFSQNQEFSYQLNPSCFNSEYDDFGVRKIAGNYYIISASIDIDSTVLIDVSGIPYTDIYTLSNCSKKDAYLNKISSNQAEIISTPFNDGPLESDRFGSLLFFSINNSDRLGSRMGIYIVQNKGNAWSDAIPFPLNSGEHDVMHPFYDDVNKTLYFTSNMKGGLGGFDLYSIPFDGSTFGKAQLIKDINSNKNDIFPTINNGVLYFSSDRIGTLGGYDIFTCQNGEVKALDNSINSKFDEIDFHLMMDHTGFVSSNKNTNGKNDDSYFFSRLVKENVNGLAINDFGISEILDAIEAKTKNLTAFTNIKEAGTQTNVLNDGVVTLAADFINDLSACDSNLNATFINIINKDIDKSNLTIDKKIVITEKIISYYNNLSKQLDEVEVVNEILSLKEFLQKNNISEVNSSEQILDNLLMVLVVRAKNFYNVHKNLDNALLSNKHQFSETLNSDSLKIDKAFVKSMISEQLKLVKIDQTKGFHVSLGILKNDLKSSRADLKNQIDSYFFMNTSNAIATNKQLESLYNDFVANSDEEHGLVLISSLKAMEIESKSILENKILQIISIQNEMSTVQSLIENINNKMDAGFDADFNSLSKKYQNKQVDYFNPTLMALNSKYAMNLAKYFDPYILKGNEILASSSLESNGVEYINFSFESDELNPKTKQQLLAIVDLLKAHSNYKIFINGYTDNTGSDEFNVALSKKRAKEVKKYLMKQGLNVNHFVVKYHGENDPLAENLTLEGRRKNRRVELKLVID